MHTSSLAHLCTTGQGLSVISALFEELIPERTAENEQMRNEEQVVKNMQTGFKKQFEFVT